MYLRRVQCKAWVDEEEEKEYLCAVVGLLFVCAVGCTMFVLLGTRRSSSTAAEDVANGDIIVRKLST